MIEIYWLLEILAVILCLCSVCNKKFRLDIYSMVFITVEIVLMFSVKSGIISENLSFVIYVFYFLYAYLEFGMEITRTVVNIFITILIIGIFQMASSIMCEILLPIELDERSAVTIVNALTLAIVFLTDFTEMYKKINSIMIESKLVFRVCFVMACAIMVYCILNQKFTKSIQTDLFVIVFMCFVVIIIFAYEWTKVSEENTTNAKRLERNTKYDDAMNELVLETRKNQHDLKNHINAIYALGLQDDKKQREQLISESSKYTKLLNQVGNKVLCGFLYSKFKDANNAGVEIIYDVYATNETYPVDTYDLVEIVGILFDNAVEAVQSNGKKIVDVKIEADEKHIMIRVENPSERIMNSDMEKFFKPGYSTKGTGRGIGLSKIRDYQKKYSFDIFVHMKEDGKNWIVFEIIK